MSKRNDIINLESPLSKAILQLLKWTLLIIVLLYSIIPIVWIILSSFKTNLDLFSSSFSLPKVWYTQNYIKAFNQDGLIDAFRNTIFVAVVATAANLIFSSMAAYILNFKFRFKNFWYLFLIAGIFIPINAFMVPYFLISIKLTVYNTVWALIILYTAIQLPMSTLIIKGYIETIPTALIESSFIDGATFKRIFRSIILPLSIPGMATAGIFQVITIWNEFLYATILTQDKASRTLQVSLRYFKGAFQTDFGAMFATLVICLIPTIVAYLFFEKQIVSGLTSGAIKA